jgi:hypothetical protein
VKPLTIEFPDDVLERAERRAAELGTSLRDEVTELVVRFGNGSHDDKLALARERMEELFRTVKGFRTTSKIPREELYESSPAFFRG